MSGAIAASVALSLAQTCAPQVSPVTLLAVAQAESGLDPLTIGVNSKPHRALHPETTAAAVAAARALLASGRNIDVGLTQINGRNLTRLGLTLEAAFDPCRNLAGGAEVLTADYLDARPGAGDAQAALTAALSSYNTGDPSRGVRNGYVAHVVRAAAQVVPALMKPTAPAAAAQVPVLLEAEAAPTPSIPPALDVFSRAASPTLVWAALPSPAAARAASPPQPRPGESS